MENNPPHMIVNFANTLIKKDYNIRNYLKIYEDLCIQYKIKDISNPYEYILNYEQEMEIRKALELLHSAIDFYVNKIY
jgi:hypothetical protein